MSNRGQLVALEALEWVGTPFVWQQSVKGLAGGCDCKGLVAGVARELGFPEAQSFEALTADYQRVHESRLVPGLRVHFAEVAKTSLAMPGDIILMNVSNKRQHLAVCIEVDEKGIPVRMVHCYGVGPSKVIDVQVGPEHIKTFDSYWRWRELV